MDVIPLAIRKRIIELYDAGYKTKYIAEAVGRSKSAVRRIRQRHRERNSLEPLIHQRGRKSGLTKEAQEKLKNLVKARPDATLAELAAEMSTSDTTVDRWLKVLKLSLKKKRSLRPSRSGKM